MFVYHNSAAAVATAIQQETEFVPSLCCLCLIPQLSVRYVVTFLHDGHFILGTVTKHISGAPTRRLGGLNYYD